MYENIFMLSIKREKNISGTYRMHGKLVMQFVVQLHIVRFFTIRMHGESIMQFVILSTRISDLEKQHSRDSI